jgi:hypothetical protein
MGRPGSPSGGVDEGVIMSPAATAPHPVDEILPLRRMIPLGIQHVFVMAASPISTFILSGLRTILQFWGPWKFGAQLPFAMLPGGAPIVLFLGIAKQYDIRTAVGAVALAAIFYFVALPVFARLLKYFPTVVNGVMIVIIGVNLIRVSGLLVTGQPGSPDFGRPAGILLALGTIGFTVLFFRVLRGGLAQPSVLLLPEMLPSWDLERELVRLANRDQILAVVVGGRPRLWRGWPVDWDARQLLEEARRRARKVGADAPVHIVHPTAGEHRRASRAGRRTKAPA